jgi:hypothetical protein
MTLTKKQNKQQQNERSNGYPDPGSQALLRTLYSIYSPSGEEYRMVTWAHNCLKHYGIDVKIDPMGNLYCRNHVEGKNRILLNAHLDTVGHHPPQVETATNKDGALIFRTKNNTPACGDDKNGVWTVLTLLADRKIKVPLSGLLCTQEEIGLRGSKYAMENYAHHFQDDVFCITIDRRGAGDLIYANSDIQLCSDDVKEWLTEYSKPWDYEPCRGSISDVSSIVKKLHINGINISCGYYNAHSGQEYTVWNELIHTHGFLRGLVGDVRSYLIATPDLKEYIPPVRTYAATRTFGGGYAYGGGVTYNSAYTKPVAAATGTKSHNRRLKKHGSFKLVKTAFDRLADYAIKQVQWKTDRAALKKSLDKDYAIFKMSNTKKSLQIYMPYNKKFKSASSTGGIIHTLLQYVEVQIVSERCISIPAEDIVGFEPPEKKKKSQMKKTTQTKIPTKTAIKKPDDDKPAPALHIHHHATGIGVENPPDGLIGVDYEACAACGRRLKGTDTPFVFCSDCDSYDGGELEWPEYRAVIGKTRDGTPVSLNEKEK